MNQMLPSTITVINFCYFLLKELHLLSNKCDRLLLYHTTSSERRKNCCQSNFQDKILD